MVRPAAGYQWLQESLHIKSMAPTLHLICNNDLVRCFSVFGYGSARRQISTPQWALLLPPTRFLLLVLRQSQRSPGLRDRK